MLPDHAHAGLLLDPATSTSSPTGGREGGGGEGGRGVIGSVTVFAAFVSAMFAVFIIATVIIVMIAISTWRKMKHKRTKTRLNSRTAEQMELQLNLIPSRTDIEIHLE